MSKRFGFWPHITHVIVLTYKEVKHLSDYRTVGLSDRRTIGPSDCRTIGLSDNRSDPQPYDAYIVHDFYLYIPSISLDFYLF